MLHFIGENLRLNDASFARMKFPKDNGFDKRKLSCYGFS